MLSKLIKYDFKKIVKVPAVFFVLSLVCAGFSRLFNELAVHGMFFSIVGIIFTSIEYALMANVLIQPIVRILTEFGKRMYGDESYLSHTLPVTKTQLLLSKSISAVLLMLMAFASVILSVFILFYSKSNMQVLNNFIQGSFGNSVSSGVILTLVIFVLLAEFLFLISIIFSAIILANKSNDRKLLKGFVYTLVFQFLATILMIVVLVVVAACMGELNLLFTSESSYHQISGSNIMLATLITGLLCYLSMAVVFFFVSNKLLKKGVNVA